MLVLGAGVPPSTFNDPKSVCVLSSDMGPRSCDFGAEERGCGFIEKVRNGNELNFGARRDVRLRRGLTRFEFQGTVAWQRAAYACGQSRKFERSRIKGRKSAVLEGRSNSIVVPLHTDKFYLGQDMRDQLGCVGTSK